MEKVINLTPHAITVSNEVKTVVYEPYGEVVRITKEEFVSDKTIDGFSVVANINAEIHIPLELEENVAYIVSSMVLEEIRNHSKYDNYLFVAPNTNKAARNEKGHIVSVPGFVM